MGFDTADPFEIFYGILAGHFVVLRYSNNRYPQMFIENPDKIKQKFNI
jgi:hypothetical protein